MEDIKSKIYESLYDEEYDPEDTFSLVIDLDSAHEEKYRNEIRSIREECKKKTENLQAEIERQNEDFQATIKMYFEKYQKKLQDNLSKQSDEFQETLKSKEEESEMRSKNLENEKKIRIDELYFRDFQKEQLKNLWRKHQKQLEVFDYEQLYDLTRVLKTVSKNKKSYLLKNVSVKLSLAILNDKYKIEGIDKNFCLDYLKLNNKYHPKLKPDSLLLSKINELKTIFESDPDLYKNCIPSIKTINMSLSLNI